MTGYKLKKYSTGQVMPLTVILIGVVTLSVIFLYNSNIVVTQRIKLQNTADAAAYSSATMDARYLNFMAYSNRAMIADHVITAQIIGVASEGRMLNKMTEKLADYLDWIPYYGKYIAIVAKALNILSTGLDSAADIEIPALNVVTNIISKAQQAFKNTYPLASAALVSKIVAANDKDADIDVSITAGRAVTLSNFLEQYSPDNAGSGEQKKRVNEFYDTTVASRNTFTSKRSGDLTGPALDKANDIPTAIIKFKVLKYGGTDMSNGDAGPRGASRYKTWAATDTISIWTKSLKMTWTGLKWSGWNTEVPLGAGDATGGRSYNLKRDTSK